MSLKHFLSLLSNEGVNTVILIKSINQEKKKITLNTLFILSKPR